MDVNVTKETFDADTVLKKLIQAFPDKGFGDREKIVNFQSWKLPELKSFLKVTHTIKGLSKCKKEELLCNVLNIWGKITAEAMFLSSSSSDIKDSDLLSLDLSSPSSTATSGFLSPLCSPSSLPQSLGSPSSSSSTTAAHVASAAAVGSYPNTVDGMTTDDFKKWTVQQLTLYLSDRCINKSGNKEKLIENVYGAYMQRLPRFTDPQQEKQQILLDTQSKLILENGMVTLPNPNLIVEDWIVAPAMEL